MKRFVVRQPAGCRPVQYRPVQAFPHRRGPRNNVPPNPENPGQAASPVSARSRMSFKGMSVTGSRHQASSQPWACGSGTRTRTPSARSNALQSVPSARVTDSMEPRWSRCG